MTRFVVKNEHQKDTYYGEDEIGLCVVRFNSYHIWEGL